MENPSQRETVEKDSVARTIDTIEAGKEWRVKGLYRSEITVKAGAKLVVTGSAARNKIIIEEGGELEIQGADYRNEIIRGGEKREEGEEQTPPEHIRTVAEIQTEVATIAESEKEKMLFTLNVDAQTFQDNVRYKAFMASGDLKVLMTAEVFEIMKNDPTKPLTPEEEKVFTKFIKELNFLSEERKGRESK